MDSKVVKLLKINEKETGKDLLSNLTEDHLKKLEFYYENLSEDEQQDIDEKIISGEDNDFIDVSLGLSGYYDEVKYDQGMKDFTGNVIEKEEGGNSTATAVKTDTTKEEKLVEEDIDPRILVMLGLEFTKDIDYGTYKTLLKEKMIAGRMTESQMPTEEIELITDEFKRIKGSEGRFVIKGQKINFDSFVGKAKEKVKTKERKKEEKPDFGLRALPPALKSVEDITDDEKEAEIKEEDDGTKVANLLSPTLNSLQKNMESIYDTLNKQYLLGQKKEDDSDKQEQKQKRKSKEAKLEKGGGKSKVKDVGKKVIKPVKSLFDMFGDFFKNILLGGAVAFLLNVLKDPAKMLQPFVDALNSVVEFMNGLIRAVNAFTNEFNFFVLNPINEFIIAPIHGALNFIEDRINDALALFGQDPLQNIPDQAPKLEIPDIPEIPKFDPFKKEKSEGGAPPVQALSGGGQVINIQNNNVNKSYSAGGSKPNNVIKSYSSGGLIKNITGGSNNNIIKSYSSGGSVNNFTSGSNNNIIKSYASGGSVKNITGGSNNNVIKSYSSSGSKTNNVIKSYASGGSINNSSGINITGAGVDTQLIAAQPGEIVMSTGAVQKYGANNLLAMNAAGGGTNKPKTVSGIQGFSGGGIVNPLPGGSVGKGAAQLYGAPRNYGPHAGIDMTENPPYKDDPKIPVVSMADGKVVASSPNYPYEGGSGYTANLSVNHGNGLLATYMHMTPHYKPGDTVKKGKMIGKLIPIGTAANAYSNTHLHLQTYQKGEKVDPNKVLNGSIKPGKPGESTVQVSPDDGKPMMSSFREDSTDNRQLQISTNASFKPSTTKASPSAPAQKQTKVKVVKTPAKGVNPPQSGSKSQGKGVPNISSVDPNNNEIMIVKSIYNLVG